MTIQQALNWAQIKLNNSPSPQLDAEVILSFILNKSKESILTHLETPLRLTQMLRYFYAIKRRVWGLPVAYILGTKEFYGRNFIVNKHVLIPRPETELIIDLVKQHYATDSAVNILDLGTGSGCLAITFAFEFINSVVMASDISKPALAVAKKNASNFNKEIIFKYGDLLAPWKKQDIDILVANLPYVTQSEIDQEPSIKKEPTVALLEKNTMIDKLCSHLKDFPQMQLIILESSPILVQGWYDKLTNIFDTKKISIIDDLAGKKRFILIDNRH